VNNQWWERHAHATSREEATYLDPDTSYSVFTEWALQERGRCCGSGCRHCPYQHVGVPQAQRADRIQRAALLNGRVDAQQTYDVLFWSGGKDSFLTWRALEREAGALPCVLLTTFSALDRRIAHQEVALSEIVRQANTLDLPLVGVPLHAGCDYVEQLREGLANVPNIRRLVFGDLHLAHIRQWREKALGPVAEQHGATLHFPLWQRAYDELFDDLAASGVPCTISAVVDPASTPLCIGQRFSRELMASVPKGIDAFGEAGEFHTLAQVWDGPVQPPPNTG
jgi:diphthamide synthase (EF-2-diphthine--ammonia ligase)